MKTKRNFQVFILPFLGGLFGILAGYIYTLRGYNQVYYALVIGCVTGVIVGAFATKLIDLKINLPRFLKKPKRQISLMESAIYRYNKKRKWYLYLILIGTIIILSAPVLLIPIEVFNKNGLFSTESSKEIATIILFFVWLVFAAVPWGWTFIHIVSKKEYSLFEDNFNGESMRSRWAKLRNFNSNAKRFSLRSFTYYLILEFKISFILILSTIIFGAVAICFLICRMIFWAILVISYGLINAIFMLLGKTIFWSSISITVLTTIYSWHLYSPFINNSLSAILLGLATGIFAGGIHYVFTYPLCNIISKFFDSLGKKNPSNIYPFFIKLGILIIDRPDDYLWKHFRTDYRNRFFSELY